ncbi:MAG: hypothetical protein HY900_28735, partial [Deltaproteobacteria bacterium]|nr:hypothetical protein [Deltaproteobacteria bacterium]
MKARSERGMVLVACLLLLALLSLLGASSLFTATVDTQLVGNLKYNREAFYAAEAALEVGAGKLTRAFLSDLRPYVPTYAWTAPQGTAYGDPYGPGSFNGYATEYRIGNALDPNHPATVPSAQSYTTAENGQQLVHFAYMYSVEAKAEGTLGSGSMTEAVRVLETPLVQYYVFFNDHLSWHPGGEMESWGRIHTNGNLYFAPQAQVTFRDFNDPAAPQFSPNQLTAAGQIRYGEYLRQDGGVLTRTPSTVRVRVRNLGTAPDLAGDYEDVTQSITPANRGSEELRFQDAATPPSNHVRVGLDALPVPDTRIIQRASGNEQEAGNPTRTLVDGMLILSDNGALTIKLRLSGAAQETVTDLLAGYEVAAGQPVSWAAWPVDALKRADGSATTALADLIPRTIVYSPEAFVQRDEAGTTYTAWSGPTKNPRYPCVLERQDGREGKEVDLTVIDLQRLELWYRDYLAWRGLTTTDRKLLIYVSRTGATVKRA